jgi:hypothetical protein
MPTLKCIKGIMSNTNPEMLIKYINNTFPNMDVAAVTQTNNSEYEFTLIYRGGSYNDEQDRVPEDA